jgi:hypothetical protein
MTAARYGCLKPLRGAQFHVCRIRRQRQRDVAGYSYARGPGFGGVRVARRRDLYGGGGRQIRRRGIDACGRDGSEARVSTGNAVHTPTHGRVRGIRHRGGEHHLVAEHDGTARRCHAHGNGRRRWWRRGGCASSAAAQCPCARREKSEECDSRTSKILSDALRKGPHALRKSRRRASEKTKGLGVRDWRVEKSDFLVETVRNERFAAFQFALFRHRLSSGREFRRLSLKLPLFQFGAETLRPVSFRYRLGAPDRLLR